MKYSKIHLINNMGAGGAQSTIRRIKASSNVFVIHGKSGHNISKLLRVLFDSNEKLHLICWLYHACFIGCILKILFRNKILLSMNIRNGYAKPQDIKITTRFIVKLVSVLSKRIDCRVNFCSKQSLEEHRHNGLFVHSKNFIVYNGVQVSDKLYTKNEFSVCTVARYEPQKNYKLVKEIIPWFAKNEVRLSILTDKKCQLADFLLPYDKNFVSVYDNSDTSALELMETATHHMLLSSSEGFANVNLEALSRGCSLICTDVGDSKIFPSVWCTIVPNDASQILENLNKLREHYDKDSFNEGLVAKNTYLKSKFPLKTEDDYV